MVGHCRECDEIRDDLDEGGTCLSCRDRAEKRRARDERIKKLREQARAVKERMSRQRVRVDKSGRITVEEK